MTDSKKPQFGLPTVALVIISIVYLIYAWDRLVFAIELVEIRKVYGFELVSAGFLATVFTLGIALTAIPAGFIVIRFGTRASLVVGAIIFSIGTGYTPLGHGFSDLTLARIVSGAGEGLYNIALFSFLGALSARYRGTLTGLAASLFGIGVFSGPLVVSALLTGTGRWEAAFYALALTGIVGAIVIWISLSGTEYRSDSATGPITVERLLRVLVPKNVAVIGVMAINGLGIYSFLGLYETFLRTGHHMNVGLASTIFSLFGIGNIVGGAPAGYVADRIGRKLYLVLALIACAISGTAAFFLGPTPWVLATVCFIFGLVVNSVYTNCYALVQDQVQNEDIPLGTGVLATIYFLMGAVSGYLLAQARDSFGWAHGSVLIYAIPYVIAAIIMTGLLLSDRRALST
jgi:MFS family permease